MKFNNPKIEKLYQHLSKISKEAYKDPFLISNIIISKQESPGRLLENYLAEENPNKINFLFVFNKLFLYLVKNLTSLAFSIITSILHYISGQKFSIKNDNELILIDTYFIVPKIIEKSKLEDIYFPSLSEHLNKRKKNFAYTPRWFGSRQPLDFFRAFRIIKEKQTPVLTHFQMLTMVDYIKTLGFLFSYPFSVFGFMKTLESTYEDKLVRNALWEVFDGVVIEHYFRLLFGQRLSKEVPGRIKCLSWYENLASDKNFYLGLRRTPKKAKIIGAQLFVRPATLMNIAPDKQEIPFKVIPDKILVNGSGYHFYSDKLRIAVGPALRYKYLFNPEFDNSREIILVLLPYYHHEAKNILELIGKVDWPVPVIIKFHSTMNPKNYEAMIPKNMSVANEPLFNLFKKTLIAIGQSTGCLIEACSLGIPVINICYKDKFSHYYMPEIGKGILWDQTYDASDVQNLIKKFQLALQKNQEKIKEESIKMRSFCFSESTEELINSAFELN